MGMYYITFRSVTLAQRGERVLRKRGVSCQLQRTPRWMEEQGCGYCLRVRELQEAEQLLESARVPFRRIYRQLKDGTVEEERR